MSNRRNLLLSYLSNSFKWLSYPFTYLYHALIPSTINSKNVKNKMRIKKIYGNSEVSNQWITTYYSGTSGNLIAVGDNTNHKVNVSGTAVGGSWGNYDDITLATADNYTTIVNHSYLVCIFGKLVGSCRFVSNISGNWGSFTTNQIITATATTTNPILRLRVYTSESAINQDYQVMFIDLTQAYPFDTPTALTDNRVQNILNNGYQTFNSGEIKSTNIGEFETEPYNLFDGEWVQNSYYHQETGVITSDNRFQRSQNLIPVVGGQTYCFALFDNISSWLSTAQRRIVEFDEYGNFIKNTISFNVSLSFDNYLTLTLDHRTKYVGLVMFNANDTRPSGRYSFNVSSSLNGTYKSHTNPQTLSFVYQGGGVGTAKNTLEKTATEWVFTRNEFNTIYNGNSNENWIEYGSGTQRYTILNNNWNSPSGDKLGNILCDKLAVVKKNDIVNKTYAISGSDGGINNFIVRIDSSITSTTLLKSWLSNNPINVRYELATPQTIRIPNKHLACVDLGSLTWTYLNGKMYADISNGYVMPDTSSIAPIYCDKYFSRSITEVANQTASGITLGNSGWWGASRVAVYDANYTNATDFKNAMSGIYLYYETENEVADIDLTMNIESGGTFTSNFFSWVENQLVSNGNFESTTGWGANASTITASGNVGTITCSSATMGWGAYKSASVSLNSSHKYLITFEVKLNSTSTEIYSSLGGGNNETLATPTQNTWVKISHIYSNVGTNNSNFTIYLRGASGTIGDTMQLRNVMFIDLTLGELNATSINDPRIQYIINHGYIPTNTTGTNKSIDTEVLPNVDTEFNSGTLPPEPEIYDITVSGTNGTYTGATSITENSTASVTISADTGYELPSSITVTNASYTYDSDTGLIVLSNPTGNVSITFACIPPVTTLVVNPTSNDAFSLHINKNDTSETNVYVDGTLKTTSTTSGSQTIRTGSLSAGQHVIEITDGSFYFDTYCLGEASQNAKITSVSLGNNVTSLGNNTFYGCNAITTVNIPNTVTSIGSQAFYQCSALTSVNIPSGITSIENRTFTRCSSLASVNIPNTVTSIGESAFNGCFALTSVNIPSGVTTIAQYCFNGCSALTSINIPSGVTTIAQGCFSGCSSLPSITIPNGTTYIGESAFKGCSALTSINIPSNVASIGNQAFYDCASLATLTVDANNTNYSAQDNILYDKNKTTLLCYPGGLTATSYSSFLSSVTTIGEYSFDNNYLTSLTMPNTITTIEENAFNSCPSLSSVVLSSNVTHLGYYTFAHCSSLTSINLNYIETMDQLVFVWQENGGDYVSCPISAINLSSIVSMYGSSVAYDSCTSLVVGDSLEKIDGSYYSTNIPSRLIRAETGNCKFVGNASNPYVWVVGFTSATGTVTIPEDTKVVSATSIDGEHVNYSFSSVVFNARECWCMNNKIGYYASSCTIGSNVKYLPAMFGFDARITTFTVPAQIQKIAYDFFVRFTSVTTLNWNATSCEVIFPSDDYEHSEDGLIAGKYSAGYSYGFSNISTLNIGNSVSTIPAYFCQGATKITSLTIPSTVISIGAYAFDMRGTYYADPSDGTSSTSRPFASIKYNQPSSQTIVFGEHVYGYDSKTAKALTINHYGCDSVVNYNYTADNVTATLNDLR